MCKICTSPISVTKMRKVITDRDFLMTYKALECQVEDIGEIVSETGQFLREDNL